MAIPVDLHHHLWLSVFGILGNIFSVFVFLAPVSTMDFDSLPYILALLSCKLWMYYGFIQENATLLILIGSIGVVVETTYILIFLVFATNQVRCQTLKELFLCIGGFYLIFVVSWFLLSGEIRVSFVGWLDVHITRSVEFLKIYMSFFLALSAIMWLGFGFMLRDMCIVDLHHHLLLSVFGILGKLFSFSSSLCSTPTFIEIYRARSTMDFDSLTYILALLSCKLWMYYGFIQENATLLIFIGSIGVVVETTYILIFLVFATNQVRCQSLKELFLCMGGFYLIFAVSWFLLSDEIRVSFVGWISVAVSIAHFASPIGIVLDVLITRSVEFLKIYISFFLALSAIMWLGFGFMLRDMCIVMVGMVNPMNSGRNSSLRDIETNSEATH
nr:bidirectional sugar transporter N3-like [Ipomoea batatas]